MSKASVELSQGWSNTPSMVSLSSGFTFKSLWKKRSKGRGYTLVGPDSNGISFHFGLSISSPKRRPFTCEAALGSDPKHLLEAPVSLGGLFNITKTNELSVTMTLQGSSYLGTGWPYAGFQVVMFRGQWL